MSGRVRAVRALIFWLDGAHNTALMTIDDDAPAVAMIDGEPFVRADVKGVLPRPTDRDEPRYYQIKPYRIDAGLLEGM